MSPGPPRFLIDRSLGRRQVPTALRAAGARLVTLAEVYGIPADELVTDVEWLERSGREDWAVLMKDDRIRYRPAEREALIAAGVVAFCLAGGNMRAAEMADLLVSRLPQMQRLCLEPGPSLHIVSRGGLRKVDLGLVQPPQPRSRG